MTYPTTYAEADALLTGRCKLSRKLGNHTYLHRIHGEPAILLHQTNIVVFHSDGSVTLNSGGWKTVTTKDRMNKAGVRVYQATHVWYIMPDDGFDQRDAIEYHDGITRSPEGVWS